MTTDPYECGVADPSPRPNRIVDPVDRWLADNPTARREGRWSHMPDWMLADQEIRKRLAVPDSVPYPSTGKAELLHPGPKEWLEQNGYTEERSRDTNECTGRPAAPPDLYSGLFGVTGENGAPGVAAGPCHTTDCTGLHWTDERAEWHLFPDRTMSEVDPAEWLARHPDVYTDGSLSIPLNVLGYMQQAHPPLPALPASPIRCTDPDCPDYGKAVDPAHPVGSGHRWTDDGPDNDDDDDPFGLHETWSTVDDPWEGRPVAKGTFRQRWLLGPKFIARWPVPGASYCEVVLMVDLRSWMVGLESWPAGGGALQIGPVQINVSEPPF